MCWLIFRRPKIHHKLNLLRGFACGGEEDDEDNDELIRRAAYIVSVVIKV